MEKVFAAINDMLVKGVISDYALGGSVGFMIWTQPFLTNDTDFFVQLPGSSLLVSLGPIYTYAAEQGFTTEHEHIVVDGEPVQIIPSPSPLFDEAIKTAVTKQIYGQTVKVMQPEYLICSALFAGRMKDFAKIEKLLDEIQVDLALLTTLVSKFGLVLAWKRYCTATGTQDPKFLHLAATKSAWRREQASKSVETKLQEIKHLRAKTVVYKNARYRAID